MASTDGDRFGVAIVGGGIVGLILAAGLIERGVYVRVYEQGRSLREIGAGIAFTKNVVRCMGQISPVVVGALRAAGSVNPSIDDGDPNAYFRWNDGYTKNEHDATYQERLYTLNAGPQGWETVRRDLFLTKLQKRMPVDVVQLGMRVENVEQPTSNGGKVLLTFADASTATFNAVIGCDGIKSKVRQILLGAEDPASHPQYTHKVAYRTLIPAAQALEALGEYRVRRLHFHVGPGAHLIHYPVNKDTIGAAVFITDPNDWPSDTSFTSRGPRTAVEIALANWSLPVTNLIRHFPAELDQWALFDMFEYPLSTYAYGQICLAGDAAHGPSPHHGAGAGMGVEDALCLAVLLEKIAKRQSSGFAGAVTAAFTTFDAVRRTRTQWLVNSSRRVCDLYQHADWADKTRHTKAKTFFEEVKDRSLKIWNFDSDAMILEAVTKLSEKLESLEINTPTIVGDWIVQFGDLPGAQVSGETLRRKQLAYLQQKEQVVMLGHGVGTTIVMRSGSADEVWKVLKDAPYSKQGVWDLSGAVLTPMKAAIVKPL